MSTVISIDNNGEAEATLVRISCQCHNTEPVFYDEAEDAIDFLVKLSVGSDDSLICPQGGNCGVVITRVPDPTSVPRIKVPYSVAPSLFEHLGYWDFEQSGSESAEEMLVRAQNALKALREEPDVTIHNSHAQSVGEAVYLNRLQELLHADLCTLIVLSQQASRLRAGVKWEHERDVSKG